MGYSLAGTVLKLEGRVAEDDYMMVMSLHGFINRGKWILKVDAVDVEEINDTVLLILDSARSILQQNGRDLIVEKPSPRFIFQMQKAGLDFSIVRKGQIVNLHKLEQSDVAYPGHRKRGSRL